jgi:hypothetical protein
MIHAHVAGGVFFLRPDQVGCAQRDREMDWLDLGKPEGVRFIKRFEREHGMTELPLIAVAAVEAMTAQLAVELIDAVPEGHA